jgi:hypothetical protein
MRPGRFGWRISEGALTALTRDDAAAIRGDSLLNPFVVCEPGDLVASGSYEVAGVRFPLTAHLHLSVVGGHLKGTLTKFEVGRLSLPDQIKAQLIGQVLKLLSGMGLSRRDTVTHVQVDRGSILIEGFRSQASPIPSPSKRP